MARRVQVVIDDDLTGGTADEAVTFGLDGVTYEIDLTTEPLGTDSAGFATIVQLVQERPSESAFVRVEYMSWANDTLFNLSLPFDRYYLEEGDGPKTEQLLTPQWNADIPAEPLPAYAVVRVLDGEVVITDLVVGERSIHEWLKEME